MHQQCEREGEFPALFMNFVSLKARLVKTCYTGIYAITFVISHLNFVDRVLALIVTPIHGDFLGKSCYLLWGFRLCNGFKNI